MPTADHWIRFLELTPHPEGGYYREIYRAGETIPRQALPRRYDGPRVFSTSIYFLLKSGQVSRLHRLASDEIWHFYDGGPLLIHAIDRGGAYQTVRLGPDPASGGTFQAVVPGGTWFGAEVPSPGLFSLVGCTLAPGFEFADFELGRREDLLRLFPGQASLIVRLTP
jgi:predicted cupin superfamily sugar epimerase